ncbi:glucose-6-phosphate isomerase [Alteromonas sp. KUL49]|uniref:glucose-6-phosphate isomerase n=1 Tax=Alteromonas sp. KUL49 TaxID=2480798 RepID=UPI00102EFDB8|nr:glucose-6-phosphate isomerase [Alteromonas sp. KUL49]TAP41634.1 glucose-6-phosphate isomerase [Alteromonas sp. KUL49]GEA10738.1 glucose-6-phosphate isomerase [Alteromonas sp. KUL49]
MSALTSLPQWQTLKDLAEGVKSEHMRDWFVADPSRATQMQLEACGLFLDYSKNRVTQDVLSALFDLAKSCGVEKHRVAMFSGDIINDTEKRAVLHTALRNFSGSQVVVDGEDVMPEVQATLGKIKAFTESIHSGEHKGYTGKAIKHIVAIGIGGSFLGPKIMTEALLPCKSAAVDVHFVANVDGCHIHDVLSKRDHEDTLIVMSSKSFTTQETLQNTISAKEWFLSQGGTQEDIAKHFVAVSSNVKAATEFGIDESNIFPMWDWVGGRYSLWSAIGLPISLALGFENFKGLLEGAHDMDKHFCEAPLEENLPVILAMLGVWYRNFFDAQSHVMLPYYHYLRGLPAYVQQLDMESNGKEVTHDGSAVDYPTGPIIWGSEGTNGQHSFHQLIHQGSGVIPADFMLPLNVPNQNDTHHAMLASNCFGQTQALMQGKSFEDCYADLEGKGLDDAERKRLAAHKTMPGNKPSNTILFDSLTPRTLGALVAMYEHKVFVQGVIWDLNSFDQWGVELGKALGNQVLAGINGDAEKSSFDASTQDLIARFRAANAPK